MTKPDANKPGGAVWYPLLIALERMIGLVSHVKEPAKTWTSFIDRHYAPASCGLNIKGLRLVVSRQHKLGCQT